jgi:hypothetical protein
VVAEATARDVKDDEHKKEDQGDDPEDLDPTGSRLVAWIA